MLEVNTKIAVIVASSLLALAFVLAIFVFYQVLKAVKTLKSANRGDVEKCVESSKLLQGEITEVEQITDESCALQYCEECSIYANSGTLPPCICGLSDG